jgi:hypothetical protein
MKMNPYHFLLNIDIFFPLSFTHPSPQFRLYPFLSLFSHSVLSRRRRDDEKVFLLAFPALFKDLSLLYSFFVLWCVLLV